MLIAVVPNQSKTESGELVRTVSRHLAQLGANVRVVCSDGSLPAMAQLTEALTGCDMAVAIGGDGTIVHVAKAAAAAGCPVLGINAGHVGFLAGLEANELDDLSALLKGEYTVDERALLEVTVHKDGGAITRYAMNEAVISRGGLSRLVDVTVRADGGEVLSCRGDGVIIATPTGSTAYSLSAGGPIVEPDAQNILITPICAHDMASRGIVASDKRIVTVSVVKNSRRNAFLSVDGGKAVRMNIGDVATVKASHLRTKLVRLKDRSFYDVVNTKFKKG